MAPLNDHAVKIAEIKKDVEHLKEHNETVLETIEKGFKELKESSKELNEKVRKLEDRKLIGQFLEKFMWLGIGAFITVLVHENYIAISNKQEYKIEKQVKKNR